MDHEPMWTVKDNWKLNQALLRHDVHWLWWGRNASNYRRDCLRGILVELWYGLRLLPFVLFVPRRQAEWGRV